MSGWSVPGYTEVNELGRGASGRVVLATHQQTSIPVAIKYLADNLGQDENFLREFRAEARILAEVEDDNVARLYEYVEDPAGAAIVMELVNGVALRRLLREQGPTEPEAALAVLKGSLLGLAASHRRGIVHRDYKPENVLVNGDGQSKLADFGIAVRVGGSGQLAGTPSYMAPEQWTGGPANPQTDIYAATATFFECLTGRPPFPASGDLSLLRQQHQSAPIPVDAAPEAVRGLLRHGLAKDPANRPRDAAVFLRELEAVASGNYGPEWEEEGKRKLARRALLLAALFPLGLASMSGTAVAASGLGTAFKALSSGVKKALVAGAATVVIVGGTVGGCVALNPSDVSDAVALPSETPAVAVSDSQSPSPSALASASPSNDPSPTASPSKKPLPKPPPSTSPACTPKTTINSSTGLITLNWTIKVCAGTTVRVTACATKIDPNNNPTGSVICGTPASILMGPAKPEVSSSLVDISDMYRLCSLPTRIRAYITTNVAALNGTATVINCQPPVQ